MSYLAEQRISFRGQFLSDVSTNNNNPENYRLGVAQETQWNTLGGAAFELLDCNALIAGSIGVDDPASNFVITGAINRPSGKMVDLDPEWQMSSELWGMGISIVDRRTGDVALEGKVVVCAFRDLWTRQESAALNGQAGGARFVSTLENLNWGVAAERSPALQALRSETDNNRLSLGIHTFGYFYNQQHPRYRTGSVMLHLGPWYGGEPHTALVHRRLQGITIEQSAGGPYDVLGDIDFALSNSGTRLHLDIGHAMRLADFDGWLLDYVYMPPPANAITKLSIGLLPPSGTPVDSANVVELTEVPISDAGWYRRTGGVVSVGIPNALAEYAENSLLGIFAQLRDGRFLLMATETDDGIFYRTDKFVRRLETGATIDTILHARQFGRPLSGFQFQVLPNRSRIAAPLPTITAPTPTDQNGKTVVRMTGVDPRHPRAALGLDGVVFNFGYGHKVDTEGFIDLSGTGLAGLDVIVVHARDTFLVPETPVFVEHIEPIMKQYAQLYPIMSEHLFDLSDYDALVANRKALLLAFGRSIEDPNYMPVTRDLSDGRMATIVKWLENVTDDPDEPLVRGAAPPSTAFIAANVISDETANEQTDAKQNAARSFSSSSKRAVIPTRVLEVKPDAED